MMNRYRNDKQRNIVRLSIDQDELIATVKHPDGRKDEIYIDLVRDPEARELAKQLFSKTISKLDTAIQDNCEKCVGACCMKAAHQIIEVNAEDEIRLAKHLCISVNELRQKHVTPMVSATDIVGSLKIKKDKNALGGGCCTFLKVDKSGKGLCSVYEARPRTCSSFPAHDCQVFVPLSHLRKPLMHREWWPK